MRPDRLGGRAMSDLNFDAVPEDDDLWQLAKVTIDWARRNGDPNNAVYGEIALSIEDFESLDYAVGKKLRELRNAREAPHRD